MRTFVPYMPAMKRLQRDMLNTGIESLAAVRSDGILVMKFDCMETRRLRSRSRGLEQVAQAFGSRR